MQLDVSSQEVERRIAASHEDVRAVYAYWQRKRGGRAMPRRADIDPAEIAPFLPFVVLVDVTGDDRQFVYRLVGTGEVAERGGDPTGRSVREAHFGGSVEEALACYGYVVQHRSPFCYRDPYAAPDGQIETDDILYLPLSDDGSTVNMILLFTHCYDYKRRAALGSPM